MKKTLILTLILSFISTKTFSAPFGYFDARSLAMGGIGVAAGDPSNASHYNPALLASTFYDKADFSLVIPSFSIGTLDIITVQKTVSDFSNSDYASALNSSITDFNNASTASEISAAASSTATASQSLLNAINDLADAASLTLNMNLAALLAVPNQTLGFSAYTSGRLIGGTNIDFSNSDTALIQSYIDVLACLGAVDASLASGTPTQQTQYATDVANCYAISPGVIDSGTGEIVNTDIKGSLTSSVKARGAIIKESGLSLAHTFPSLSYTSLGVTAKTVKVTTFDTSISINSASVSTSNGQNSYSNLNLDFGMVMPFSNNFKVAAVVKNIIRKNYGTVLGNTISVYPQYRVGAAFQNEWVTIGVDYDISRNKSVAFEKDTQYVAIGTEIDIFDTMQLRFGFRNNTVAADKVTSIGLGFNPGMNIDLALALGNDGYELGFQLGVKF